MLLPNFDWKLVYRKEAGHIVTEEYEAPYPPFGDNAFIHAFVTIEPNARRTHYRIIH